MGDIITIHAPHAPQWKRLYEAAILELDPAKLLQRIAVAQSAVLDQIADGSSKPSDGQQLALHDVLHMLSTLRTIAERDIGE
jgi:ketopantoate hydroxymethyltransferase